jgi:hypothetical protein
MLGWTYIGLDVHKDTIAVALAERANGAKCVSMARSPTPHLQLVSKLARGGHRLRFCYEAGAVRLWDPADRDGRALRRSRAPPCCRSVPCLLPPNYRQGSLADRTAGSKICCCWVTKAAGPGRMFTVKPNRLLRSNRVHPVQSKLATIVRFIAGRADRCPDKCLRYFRIYTSLTGTTEFPLIARIVVNPEKPQPS